MQEFEVEDFEDDGFRATERSWLESVKVARALRMTGPYGLCWPVYQKGPAWTHLAYEDEDVREFIDEYSWAARERLNRRWGDAGFSETGEIVEALISALLSLDDQPAHDFRTIVKAGNSGSVVQQRRMMIATVYLETALSLKATAEVFERPESDAVKDAVIWLYALSGENWPVSAEAVRRARESGPMKNSEKANRRRSAAQRPRREKEVLDGGNTAHRDKRAVAG